MARYYEITVGAAQAFFGRCNLETARTKARDAAVVHGAPATVWRAWHPKVTRAREAFERVDAFGNTNPLTMGNGNPIA